MLDTTDTSIAGLLGAANLDVRVAPTFIRGPRFSIVRCETEEPVFAGFSATDITVWLEGYRFAVEEMARKTCDRKED